MRTGSHGATDLSPVCMAAALHFDLAVPNFGLQEYMRHTDETDAVFPHGYRFADGCLHPSRGAGPRASTSTRSWRPYPYRPAYLPVARRLDGTRAQLVTTRGDVR